MNWEIFEWFIDKFHRRYFWRRDRFFFKIFFDKIDPRSKNFLYILASFDKSNLFFHKMTIIFYTSCVYLSLKDIRECLIFFLIYFQNENYKFICLFRQNEEVMIHDWVSRAHTYIYVHFSFKQIEKKKQIFVFKFFFCFSFSKILCLVLQFFSSFDRIISVFLWCKAFNKS